MGVTENLIGTRAFKDLIDSSAREGATLGKFDLNGPLREARERVLAADLSETIETVQGSISVSDYLVTRCVEAVVHGRDLIEPVSPDPAAESITSTALLNVLSALSPELLVIAEALPTRDWIDVATGRVTITGILSEHNTALAHGVFHEMEGFIIFAIAFAMIFVLHMLINWIYRWKFAKEAPVV